MTKNNIKAMKILVISLIVIIINSMFITSQAAIDWNLYFENIQVTEGSVNAVSEPTIIGSEKAEITYTVNLNTPGEFYEFTVNIVNAGTLDAMVSEVNNTQLTEEQKKYLTYDVKYIDGTEVKKNDKLAAGAVETIKVRLEYRKDITAEDLPKEDAIITLSLNTCYVQADNNAVEREETNTNKTTDNNISDNNENTTDSKTNNEDENENNSNSIVTSKNAKTGDNILKYVVILILAILALVITKINTAQKEGKFYEKKKK